MKGNSKVIKKSNNGWNSVPEKVYKTETDNFRGIRRFSLLGEGKNEQELNFQTRYFEIEAGGYSSLEFHRHPHSVVVINGSGSVILGESVEPLELHDVVYISPETIHQFHADNGETLGFLCIVDRYRDKPVIPDDAKIDEVISNGSAARKKLRK